MSSGTAARTPRFSPHGTNNAIPAVCGGVPPHGPRGQKRGAPQTSGGHGASLGESRQGNGSEELLVSGADRIFPPRRGIPEPSAATRPVPSGLGSRSPSPNIAWRNADTSLIAPSGPHGNLVQRTELPARSLLAGLTVSESLTRVESRAGRRRGRAETG